MTLYAVVIAVWISLGGVKPQLYTPQLATIPEPSAITLNLLGELHPRGKHLELKVVPVTNNIASQAVPPEQKEAWLMASPAFAKRPAQLAWVMMEPLSARQSISTSSAMDIAIIQSTTTWLELSFEQRMAPGTILQQDVLSQIQTRTNVVPGSFPRPVPVSRVVVSAEAIPLEQRMPPGVILLRDEKIVRPLRSRPVSRPIRCGNKDAHAFAD
jgi:hypothetical protein